MANTISAAIAHQRYHWQYGVASHHSLSSPPVSPHLRASGDMGQQQQQQQQWDEEERQEQELVLHLPSDCLY
jgi:hypothetical protein